VGGKISFDPLKENPRAALLLVGDRLRFSSSATTGEGDTSAVTVTATNGNVGPAYTTQIAGFKLTQILGPRCSPQITAPGSFPIALGDIPTSGAASTAFNVSFAGCRADSVFLLSVPWSSVVYHTGTFETILDFKKEREK
jgi:endo-1,4-beta-xylanase